MTRKNTKLDTTTFDLTADQIEKQVETVLEGLALIFNDEITETVEVEGENVERTKNRLWFISNSVVNGFVWKLESMMLDAHAKMLEHRSILQAYENAETGIVTQRMRDDKQFWLDQHTESFQLTGIAFKKAQAMHEALTGRAFKTAAERKAEQAARKSAVKARQTRVTQDDASALEAELGLTA